MPSTCALNSRLRCARWTRREHRGMRRGYVTKVLALQAVRRLGPWSIVQRAAYGRPMDTRQAAPAHSHARRSAWPWQLAVTRRLSRGVEPPLVGFSGWCLFVLHSHPFISGPLIGYPQRFPSRDIAPQTSKITGVLAQPYVSLKHHGLVGIGPARGRRRNSRS